MMQEKNKEIVEQMVNFLGLKDVSLSTDDVVENVKELCVARLCKGIGISFKYDYSCEYFKLFANVVGEAVSRILGLGLTVGDPVVRFIRYNGVNLVDRAIEILEIEDVEEAFIDLYNYLEDTKGFVPRF